MNCNASVKIIIIIKRHITLHLLLINELSCWFTHVKKMTNGINLYKFQTNNYIEAKEYSDIIVYDLLDDYQNLTLKTALMLQWTLQRCPSARFLYKIDDDMLINPWKLEEVLRDHAHAELTGEYLFFFHIRQCLTKTKCFWVIKYFTC